MRKKIAIMTLFHNNYNYGGMLQSYALTVALHKMGYDAYQIDYVNNNHNSLNKNNQNNKMLNITSIGDLYVFMCSFFNNNSILYSNARKKMFDIFIENIPHTKVVDNKNISSLNDDFNIFICGSDQIWKPEIWNDDYFLNFVSNNNKKIAYAVSMACNEITDEELRYLSSKISGFSNISVREQNALSIVSKIFSGCKLVCDPCLLLNKDWWENEYRTKSRLNIDLSRPYIFAYLLGNKIRHRRYIKKIANEKNMKVISIPYLSSKLKSDEIYFDELVDKAGPVEFLELIANADIVYTDSFHGMIFSIIFNKDFRLLERNYKNEKSMFSRMNSILHELGGNLENVVINDNELNIIDKEIKIDYKIVKDNLNNAINDSYQFLYDALEGC